MEILSAVFLILSKNSCEKKYFIPTGLNVTPPPLATDILSLTGYTGVMIEG